MSKWADIYSKHDDVMHTVPIDKSKMPCNELRDAAFGHVPFIECACKPHVRFSTNGEYLVVEHRDVTRGGCETETRETYQ